MPRHIIEPESPKKRIAPNGYRLPDPIKEGEILTDLLKRKWRLGRSIGVGGFGEIYLASDDTTKPVGVDAKYAIKVEPHANGPLFVEMNFYLRVARLEKIDRWVAENGLKALGMPYYVGAGSHMYKGERYRFLVIPRFGEDLEKLLMRHKRKLHIKTVLTLASYIVDTLEYIHRCGYVHADIKPGNLLLGMSNQAPVYLLDYGLACRYQHRNGKHKEYCVDERRANYGTIEYTSCDAHIGAISRRGDLEILGYNMVHWLTGHLPWEEDLADPEVVEDKKRVALLDLQHFLWSCFNPDEPPDALEKFLNYIRKLNFDSQPDYKFCKKIFRKGIKDAGYVDDGKLTFTAHSKLNKSRKRKNDFERENIIADIKRMRVVFDNLHIRQPCATQNSNRMTRNTVSSQTNDSTLQDFDWATVLAGHPEKKFQKEKDIKCTRSQTMNLKNGCEYSNRTPKEASTPSDEDSLSNPTPAMLQVIARIRQRAKEAALSTNSSSKRTKSESSRCSSPVDWNNTNMLTPAMEEVIRRRDSNNKRRTRSSSRKCSVTKLNLSLNATLILSPELKTPMSPQKRSTRLSSVKC